MRYSIRFEIWRGSVRGWVLVGDVVNKSSFYLGRKDGEFRLGGSEILNY